jgi:hypothetical protein
MSLATSNAFALLKGGKTNKIDKKKSGKDDKKKSASAADLEKAIFSQPSLNISNWADDDDDDYAMPALPADWAEVRARTASRAARRGFTVGRQLSCSRPAPPPPLANAAAHAYRYTTAHVHTHRDIQGQGPEAAAGEHGEEHDEGEHEHEEEHEESDEVGCCSWWLGAACQEAADSPIPQ